LESKALKAARPSDGIEASPRFCCPVGNAMKGTCPERDRRLREGERPWRENPKSKPA